MKLAHARRRVGAAVVGAAVGAALVGASVGAAVVGAAVGATLGGKVGLGEGAYVGRTKG